MEMYSNLLNVDNAVETESNSIHFENLRTGACFLQALIDDDTRKLGDILAETDTDPVLLRMFLNLAVTQQSYSAIMLLLDILYDKHGIDLEVEVTDESIDVYEHF